MALIAGLTGKYSGLPEAQIPAPPQWLATWSNVFFVRSLESFLHSFGVDDYTLTSLYRNAEKNAAVGGKKNSAHPFGVAGDVKIHGPIPSDLVSSWINETGGYALNEGTHIHFNWPRSSVWQIAQWTFTALVIIVLLVAVIAGTYFKKA